MQRLHLLGMNHTTAPLPVREKLAFDAEQRRAALESFSKQFPHCEMVLLCTCNRVEFYLSRETHGHPQSNELVDFMAQERQVSPETFRDHLYDKSDRDVVQHLFSVASSLDSMVLGESQILGQVRQAYDASRLANLAGPMLNPLFQRAIAVGKQVLGQTPLGEGRVSVASLAVDYARKIFDDFSQKSVLSIGAGKMAQLVLQHLSRLSPRTIWICNRDQDKAAALAAKFAAGAGNVRTVPFEQLFDQLAASDIIVSSTGSPQPIITRAKFEAAMKRRRFRPVFLIDIAVPRDIEASVADVENVYLYNLDDLQQVVSRTLEHRQDAIDQAGKIILEHVEQFLRWNRTRQLGPAIEQLYRKYHGLAEEELNRTLGKIPDLTQAERQHLEDLTRRIVNKLLHDPIHMLRETDSLNAPTGQYLQALRSLFKLPEMDSDEPEDSLPPGQ